MVNIDWESSQTYVLVNPRLPSSQKDDSLSTKIIPSIPSHLWLSTSGSSGLIKWVALAKQSILSSALAVNKWLESDSLDIWVNALPQFHVGGLGVMARAYLSQSKVIDFYTTSKGKWDPIAYHQILCCSQATWSALVPTQVYDLVIRNLTSPCSLKGIIVGGGKLQNSLYLAAARLGWKLLPSYGLTESSSQVATAHLSEIKNGCYPTLKVLPHVEVAITAHKTIKIKGPSLLSLYGIKEKDGYKFYDPKKEDWFTTEDYGSFDGKTLNIIGRESTFLKIGGESTNLNRLEELWNELCFKHQFMGDAALMAEEDERLGHSIHLYISKKDVDKIQPILADYNQAVMPYERIRLIHTVDEIPRSPLGKVIQRKM